MASYDLTEDTNYHHRRHENDDNFDDDDDAAGAAYDYNYDTVVDSDDANANANANATGAPMQNEISGNSNVLMPGDVLWSVEIFGNVCKVIVDYAEQVIQVKKEECDDDDLTSTTSATCSGNGVDASGLILSRHGHDESSFLLICREAGLELEAGDGDGDDDSNSVARVLQKLKAGTALEILIAALLATNKARLSCDGDIIVLYPFAVTNVTDLDDAASHTVNDADIAIFKISSAIKALERRIERLGKQADEAHAKALAAKRAGNTKVALLHLKRRQICLKEVENCSGSLLNLDGGLHSIKRAKNDAEVLKTFELVNNSMRVIRQESNFEDVEDVMNELAEHNDDLNELHRSLCVERGDNVFSNDDLEQELATLMENDTTTSNDIEPIGDDDDVDVDVDADVDVDVDVDVDHSTEVADEQDSTKSSPVKIEIENKEVQGDDTQVESLNSMPMSA